MRHRRQRRIAVSLEGVDPQIDRRATRQRRTLVGPFLAEYSRKIGIEPLRIVAAHMGRRIIAQGGRRQRVRLGMIGGRRRVWDAVREPRNRIDRHAALEPQCAKEDRARR